MTSGSTAQDIVSNQSTSRLQ